MPKAQSRDHHSKTKPFNAGSTSGSSQQEQIAAVQDMAPKLTVIIPTLNEAKHIASLLRQLRESELESKPDLEIILVDAMSSDSTIEEATPFADTILSCKDGLAAQLNLGAKHAKAQVLLFLYADSRLASDWRQSINSCMNTAKNSAGAFRLKIDSPAFSFRIIELTANWRSSLGIGPMGDQGLFIRRKDFQKLNGFDSSALLVDLDFSRRCRQLGKIQICKSPIESSARRWEQQGLIKTTLKNWQFLLAGLSGRQSAKTQAAYKLYRCGGGSPQVIPCSNSESMESKTKEFNSDTADSASHKL